MQRLNDNWITEKHIDFEYKKYILLAYFQEVNQVFNVCKLYPALSDLLIHYQTTLALKENKTLLASSFPKRLTGIDIEDLKLQYEELLNDDDLMHEIECIIDYSLPKFKYYMEEGKKIYDAIEEHMALIPIGVVPLHIQEGYLLLKDTSARKIKVFQYFIKLFTHSREEYRAIYTDFIGDYSLTYSNTYEQIKLDLLNNYKSWPNPATYAVDTDITIPFQETYLPIAKRMLVRYISQKAA
ncbi:MAG TPA: hypothetical protein VFF27_03345 [Bacteroidia bacterium]|jgi:hypothetical protein|nr:hypothetical protein [Bacteroidia bacterium]